MSTFFENTLTSLTEAVPSINADSNPVNQDNWKDKGNYRMTLSTDIGDYVFEPKRTILAYMPGPTEYFAAKTWKVGEFYQALNKANKHYHSLMGS